MTLSFVPALSILPCTNKNHDPPRGFVHLATLDSGLATPCTVSSYLMYSVSISVPRDFRPRVSCLVSARERDSVRDDLPAVVTNCMSISLQEVR